MSCSGGKGDQGRGVISVLQTVWSHCGMRWGSLQPKLDSDGTSWEALTLPSHLKLPYPQKETLHIFSHGSHIKIHRSYAQTDITQIWETWGKNHPRGPLKEMWDFSSLTEQTVSMIHRWLRELQGIRMAIKKDPNWEKQCITHLISTDLCIGKFKR